MAFPPLFTSTLPPRHFPLRAGYSNEPELLSRSSQLPTELLHHDQQTRDSSPLQGAACQKSYKNQHKLLGPPNPSVYVSMRASPSVPSLPAPQPPQENRSWPGGSHTLRQNPPHTKPRGSYPSPRAPPVPPRPVNGRYGGNEKVVCLFCLGFFYNYF